MASKYLQKYPVPDGFQEILHDFTREILRDQPDDIIKYAADYFECQYQGRPFNFESKFNISKNQNPKKAYNPIKSEELAAKAKHVVDRSNSGGQRVQSGQSNRQPSQTSSRESYADEKKVTRQFVGQLYSKVVDEICDGEEQQDEPYDAENQEVQQGEEEEDQEGGIESQQFDDHDMKKIVKIQSHIRGTQVRSKTKIPKKE